MKRRKSVKGRALARPATAAPARSPFSVAFADWASARAALSRLDVAGASDREMSRSLGAALKADWRLLQTPRLRLIDIRDLARAVQVLHADAVLNGRFTDNRHGVALAMLIDDVLRFTPTSADD